MSTPTHRNPTPLPKHLKNAIKTAPVSQEVQMNRANLLVLVAITACSAHVSKVTKVIETDECARKLGGFVPGIYAYTCDLFDNDGKLIDQVKVKNGNQCHVNPHATFVRCTDKCKMPVWPIVGSITLCFFEGDPPRCPLIDPVSRQTANWSEDHIDQTPSHFWRRGLSFFSNIFLCYNKDGFSHSNSSYD